MQILLLLHLAFVKSVDVRFESALAHRFYVCALLFGLRVQMLVRRYPLEVKRLKSGCGLLHIGLERRGRLEVLLSLLREFRLFLRPLLLILLLPFNDLLANLLVHFSFGDLADGCYRSRFVLRQHLKHFIDVKRGPIDMDHGESPPRHLVFHRRSQHLLLPAPLVRGLSQSLRFRFQVVKLAMRLIAL